MVHCVHTSIASNLFQGSYRNLTVVFQSFPGQNYFFFQTFRGILFIFLCTNPVLCCSCRSVVTTVVLGDCCCWMACCRWWHDGSAGQSLYHASLLRHCCWRSMWPTSTISAWTWKVWRCQCCGPFRGTSWTYALCPLNMVTDRMERSRISSSWKVLAAMLSMLTFTSAIMRRPCSWKISYLLKTRQRQHLLSERFSRSCHLQLFHTYVTRFIHSIKCK